MHFEYYDNNAPGLLGSLRPLAAGSDWRWRLRADNGEPVASGEGYHNLADCLYAIDLLKSTTAATEVRKVKD